MIKNIIGYNPQCRQTVANKLKIIFKSYQNNLINALKRIDNISLTSDLSRAKSLINYLTITAHFFDKRYNYHSIRIAYKKFSGQHTSDKIEEFIRYELEELQVPIEKILTITTDSGSDIKSAGSKIGTRFACICHHLNLIVKNSLKLFSSTTLRYNLINS